jgi:2-polyprenyl-3-methyl-5-hydroxy-6-metoxy-1,4-benzoquinol methylase
MTDGEQKLLIWSKNHSENISEPESQDDKLPDSIDRLNLVLNRRRLRTFLEVFSSDADVRDILLLDSLAQSMGLPLSSTGLVDLDRSLALRPFRTWEYVWLFKILELRRGGMRVLDLGGPISHIVFLAALAGNEVLTLDIDERAVDACNRMAQLLGLKNIRAEVCDMRKLQRLADGSFHRVLSCSVLEHLTGADQTIAVKEMGRVLKNDGRIGLTFDYGESAASANIHLPPPHDPPRNPAEVVSRLAPPGLEMLDNREIEEPLPGSLFESSIARYTIAALFLAKQPVSIEVPRPSQSPSLLGNLTVPRLPELINAAASGINLRRHREEAEKQSWVNQFNQLNERIAIIEEAAQERLVLLERTHNEAARLRGELRKQQEINEALSNQGILPE